MKNNPRQVPIPAYQLFSSAPIDSSGFFHDRPIEYKLCNSDKQLRPTRIEGEQLSRLYQVLKRTNKAIIRATDKESLFAQLNEILSESALFSMAGISNVNPMTGELDPVCFCYDLDFQQGFVKSLFDRVFAGHCSGTAREFRLLNDLALDGSRLPWREIALDARLHAFTSLPIAFGNQFYGTIALFADTPDYFGSDLIDLLRQIAEGLAYALHTQDESVEHQTYELGLSESRRELKELLLHLHSAREDERSLVARELHDELGQTLNALKLDLCALGNDQTIHVPLQEKRLARMTEAIDHALGEVHRVVSALCPRILSDLGLGPAAEWLINDFNDQSGLSCRLKLDLPQQHDIPRAMATTAFRCIQECLTNISQHSTATSVSIRITLDRNLLNLSISDNGRVSLQVGPTANSFGNISMRQRVELLGGSLKKIDRSGHGTCIEIVLPIIDQTEKSTLRKLVATQKRDS